MTLRTTKNDLAGSVRSRMVSLLNGRLADLIDLTLHAKQAHWNVRGPNFISLHELFDKVHADARGWVDLTAERVAQLGGLAAGTLSQVSGATQLPAYPKDAVAERTHVEALAASVAAVSQNLRAAVGQAEESRDAATADLFTEILRGSDESLWMLEAHLDNGEA